MVNESWTRAISNIISKKTLRAIQLETMETIATALANSYGPDGSTTQIRTMTTAKDAGTTEYTKDGHKILSNIKFNKPIEYSIVDDLKAITTNTVKTVGDGTTSAVILSYLIFKELKNLADETGKSEKTILNEFNKLVKRLLLLLKKMVMKLRWMISIILHILLLMVMKKLLVISERFIKILVWKYISM